MTLGASASDQLVFSTYLGGSDVEEVRGVAVDPSGSTYIVGLTATPGLPATPGAFDTTLSGEFDGFVAKLNATGTIEFVTYVGGTGADIVLDVALDGTGNVIISGSSDSDDFPTTTDGYDRTYNGERDGFIATLSGDGASLLYSTYLGGSGRDEAAHLALGDADQVYVAGPTFSSDFPTTPGAFDTAIVGGLENSFVSRLDIDAGTLAFSTYIEGVWYQQPADIAVDPVGNPIVVGFTDSPNFPTTPGAYDTTVAGRDGFVVKLSADGSTLLYGSFFGGSNTDLMTAVAVDSAGIVYGTGYTASTDFPATGSAVSGSFGGGVFDAFVFQLDLQGGLLYSTYLGGGGDDSGRAIVNNGSGAAFVVGSTTSDGFPTTSTAMSTARRGDSDVFLLRLTRSGLSYSTYFGGSGSESGVDLASGSGGDLHIVGATGSVDLPVAGGASDSTLNGLRDAFVAKARIPAGDGPADEAPTFPWLFVLLPLGVAGAAVAIVGVIRSRRRRKQSGPPDEGGPGPSR